MINIQIVSETSIKCGGYGKVSHVPVLIQKEKVSSVNCVIMPAANQLMELIHNRRSNRTKNGRQVSEDKTFKIAEVEKDATTAGNTRQVTIAVGDVAEAFRQIINSPLKLSTMLWRNCKVSRQSYL